MKKILITGAAGALGLSLIKYLLAEGKYEVTVLDLKNQKVFKRFKKYRRRINTIYGDVLDSSLVESLIKENDVVIHLASCLPPFAELKQGLSEIIECNGTENIVKAINYYNPKCHLIYASSTSIYDKSEACVEDKIKEDDNDYYNASKFRAEKIIKKKLNKYTIVRVPLLLTDLNNDSFIYNIDKNDQVEVLSKEDAAYAFCKCLDKLELLNKKTINIGGGKNCRIKYSDLLNHILRVHGVSLNYINNRLFIPKNYRSPILLDSDESNRVLNYRNDSITSYCLRQKRKSKFRKFRLLIGKLFYIK